MTNVKKLTAAVAMAIGTAGVGVGQADEIMYPYVVSSQTVTTILTAAVQGGHTVGSNVLHYRYHHKLQTGDAKADRDAKCTPGSRIVSSSPNDLVDVSVDGIFGDAQGVMFEDGISAPKQATYSPPGVSLAVLEYVDKPQRAFVILDNNESAGMMGSTGNFEAARATIVELVAGAAWGYDAYDPKGSKRGHRGRNEGTAEELAALNGHNEFDFSNRREKYGEVIQASSEGPAISFKPYADTGWQTMFYVTPIDAGKNNCSNELCQAGSGGGDQDVDNLVTKVRLHAPDLSDEYAIFDRDEQPYDGAPSIEVTCVGAINLVELLPASLRDYPYTADQGGWAEVLVQMPNPDAAEEAGKKATDEATIMFLEWNLGDLDGQLATGVINNGFQLRD